MRFVVAIVASGAAFGCYDEPIYDLGETSSTSVAASGGASSVSASTNASTTGMGGMGGAATSSTDATTTASTSDTSSSSTGMPVVTCKAKACGTGSICTCTGNCDSCIDDDCEAHATKSTCNYVSFPAKCSCEIDIGGTMMKLGSCEPEDSFCLVTNDQCCTDMFIQALGG